MLVLPPSFPVRRHGEPAPDVRHADGHRRRQEPGLADRARAGALVVGQPRHQRDLERLLAERGLHRPTSSGASSRRSTAAQRADMEARARPPQPRARDGETLRSRDQVLHIDLKGRDPDDGLHATCPTRRARCSCASLEEVFGRDALRRVPARLLRPLRLPEHHHRRLRRAT